MLPRVRQPMMSGLCILGAALFVGGPALAQSKSAKANTAPNPQKSARITYAAPENPAHVPIRDALRDARVLEQIRDVMSVFRMPKPVALVLSGCKGDSNAWYEPENQTITVCYEYIAEVVQQAPLESIAVQIDRQSAIAGPTFEVFLHEAGHAIFDLFRVPIFGREEDAADQFAAFMMLKLEDSAARRLILGVGYMYMADAKVAKPGVQRYADEHSVPEQRFYNLMCMAYGAKPKLFEDAVDRKYLTPDRAVGCAQEYQQIAYAMSKLLAQHIDRDEARQLQARAKLWKPAAQR